MPTRPLTPWPLTLGIVTCALAGDLNPPPGPIAQSFRTLDQICPGIPLSTLPSSAEAVHVIQQQGRFILDADLNGQAGKHGILIDNPGGPVFIECNGYSIRGVAGSLDAIHGDNVRTITIATAHIEQWDGDAVDVVIEDLAFNYDKIKIQYSSISNIGGNGIRISPPTGVLAHRLEIQLDELSMSGIGARGVNVFSGEPGNDIHLTISDSTFIDGRGHAINVDPPLSQPAPGRTYLKYKLDRCFIKSWSTSGDADGVRVPFPSAGSISSVLVEDVSGDGIRVADDAFLTDVQVASTGGDAVEGGNNVHIHKLIARSAGANGVNVDDGARVRLANVYDSGGGGIFAGDDLTLTRSTISRSGGDNIAAGDQALIDQCTSQDAMGRNMFTGEYMVVRASHTFGPVSTGRGARLIDSQFVLDMNSASYAPHILVGGEHHVEGCEFRVAGNDPMKLPTMVVNGDESSIMHSKFLMQDTPVDPVFNVGAGTAPAIIVLDGNGCEFSGNTVAHIWSPTIGLSLAAGRTHFVVQSNRFIGARGLGAVGVKGDASNSLIMANTFSGLGPSGMPIDLMGAGNVSGALVSGSSAVVNDSPDRNLVVP